MRIGSKGVEYTSVSGAFITLYHLGLLVGLPIYFYFTRPSWALVVVSLVLLFLTELGITAAYHRLYSHRSFNLSRPIEAILLALGTLGLQGSVLQWSHDHRKHHAHVDTDDDPYSINKGFWYAHMLWLYDPPQPIETKWVADLMQNRLVTWQHRYFALLGIGGNLLVFLLIGWLVGDFLGAFVIAWWTRLLVSHHLTWFINSLAHYWGSRTYSREHSAVDNYIIAFLTMGEGYHNYHHTFAADYRNGVRWYHFDPSKWLVWGLERVGLATDLKRYDSVTIKKKLLAEDRRLLLEAVKRRASSTKLELEQRIVHLSEAIRLKLNRIHALAEEVNKLKRGRQDRARVRAALDELKRLKHSLRHDWRSWGRLCGAVLAPHPA
ncbi:MAG TPA: fatty acid desaturase [Candidatus Polarisedimenticolaceae bacterium]|nr:fatty acid desaturase [Candidatus Polarisedimenticolaceae bacterium]